MIKKKNSTKQEQRALSQPDKGHFCEKPTGDIMLNGERLDIFSWDQEQDKDVSLVPLLCNILLKMLLRAIGQEKAIKDIQDWKRRNKIIFIFRWLGLV